MTAAPPVVNEYVAQSMPPPEVLMTLFAASTRADRDADRRSRRSRSSARARRCGAESISSAVAYDSLTASRSRVVFVRSATRSRAAASASLASFSSR